MLCATVDRGLLSTLSIDAVNRDRGKHGQKEERNG
jgi:hypothetical protein